MRIASGRIPAIDTLRGLAAFIIIFWHYPFFFGPKPFPSVFAPFYTNGQAAVDVFFVISGFILSYVYLSRISDASDAWRYVVKRIARLYPLHFVTLIVVAAIAVLSRNRRSRGAIVAPDATQNSLVEFPAEGAAFQVVAGFDERWCPGTESNCRHADFQSSIILEICI